MRKRVCVWKCLSVKASVCESFCVYKRLCVKVSVCVCDANYCVALLLFCLNTPLLDCLYDIFNIYIYILFLIWCLHTNKRRPAPLRSRAIRRLVVRLGICWDVVVGCRGLLTLGKRHLIALHCWFRVPAGLLVFVKIALVTPKLAIGCILLTFGSGISTTPRWDIDQTLGKLHFGQLSRQKGLEMLEPFGWAELEGSIKIILNQSLNVPARYSQTAISSVETWAWECESTDGGKDSNLSGSCKLNAVVTVRRASDAFWNGR